MEAKHDVLLVGAGCAGMRAAIEAHDAGADVGVVSKLLSKTEHDHYGSAIRSEYAKVRDAHLKGEAAKRRITRNVIYYRRQCEF